MKFELEITIDDTRWSDIADLKEVATYAISSAYAESQCDLESDFVVSLLFCSDSRIQDLNREWRSQDKATNVLSFPAPQDLVMGESLVLGDLALSYETVLRESEIEEKKIVDHLSHLIIHGFLHLLGFDHETESEAEEMEWIERRSLAKIGIMDPYANSEIDGQTK
jgi:probable rRNA maturation factor